MDRLAGGPTAFAGDFKGLRLAVVQFGLDVPQAIAPAVATKHHPAVVQVRAGSGRRKGHGENLSDNGVDPDSGRNRAAAQRNHLRGQRVSHTMSLRSMLRRLMPTREQLQAGRFTRWLAPFLGHAKLWHWSRRGVAAGVAVGILFVLLVLIAQIPLSVGAAIVMRANVPAAVSSTLVSKPLPFAPIYYLAYRTGLLVTGDEVRHPERELARITARADADEARAGGVRGVVERVRALGKPLIIGLAIFAVAGGLLA